MSRFLCGCAVLACALSLAAQTPDTATITGKITDASDAPVAGVEITVKNTQSSFQRTAVSGPSGAYSVAGLPIAGRYDIAAVKEGFAAASVNDVQLEGGLTATVDLKLNVAANETRVTVTGVTGEVRSDEPQLGTMLESRQIEDMPLLNQRITYLPLLNAANKPAINQGDVFMNEDLFTTNGAGRRQAWFEVDGSDGIDMWGRQTVFSNIPRDAILEMGVLTNAFSAEYGGSMGSVVNVITKSGGDKIHGDVVEVWRPAALSASLSGFTAANAGSGNDIASDSLGQSDVSLAGPIGSSGDTHFFVAGELSREDRGSPVISPVAPGVFVGHYRGALGYFRLDHRFNDKHNLFFRSDADGFHDTNPNGTVGGNSLPTVDRVFSRRTYSEELGETAVFSPTLLNTAHLQFQLASPITQFDPVNYGTQYSVPISAGGTFTTGTSQSALLMNRQYQFNDVVSTIKGHHQIKFGADVIYAHTGGDSKEFGGPIYLGMFSYNPCTSTLSICESAAYLDNIANVKSYTQSYGNASYTVDDVLWAAFVQDDWKIRPNFTINLGLRYERQTFADSTKDFAPRAGFSWDIAGNGKTVLRGGFGIYYSQIVDNSEANYALTGPTGVFNYTASPGQVGFPTSVAGAPLPAFPLGATAPVRSLYIRPGDASYYNQFFPTNLLIGYQNGLWNPYSEQWTFGVERQLKPRWVLAVDYVGNHSLRIVRPLDVDPPSSFLRTAPGQVRSPQAANCTRPYWIWWYQQNNLACNSNTATNPQPPYAEIQADVNDGYLFYDALDVSLNHSFGSRASMLVSYTWSHAIDNVDPDATGQNPNDPRVTGKIENGNALFDERQRLVASGMYILPGKITVGGILTLGSGFPFNYATGANNSGDGATTDRPVIDGVVVGRNTGLGRPIYDFSPFVERPFDLFGERVHVTTRVEAFNATNHANFVGYSGTWGNGATAGVGFGAPLAGITAQLPARSLQFMLRVAF